MDALILIEALLIIIAAVTYKAIRFISPSLYDSHPVAVNNKSTNVEQATFVEEELCSCSFNREWTYDVFLNFRGKDTRFNFTKNLYHALQRKGIHTFMDDEGLKIGREITPSLLKAIQESRIAITIFSKNYASSTFCLDELVQILECIKKEGRLVLPIFYDVDPAEVRHQSKTYKEAFAKHEKRFKNDEKKVQIWKQALRDAANLSGLHFRPRLKYESCMIEEIIKVVSRKINRSPLHVTKHPVGVEFRVQRVKSLLNVGSNERVQMVGICGIGGIGKTTIARALYNSIVDSLEGGCFLANIRENSKNNHCEHLQEMVLFKIVGEDIKIVDVHEGGPIIKHRLHQKKVLLVLDDVDNRKQLYSLVGGLDWFGFGSRIIVTTRDRSLLASHGVERIYEVDILDKKEALDLLTWNSFGQNRVDPCYMKIFKEVARYACGLPLALEVIGSNLFKKGVDEWISALEAYQRFPIKEIQHMLKISYDALEEHQQEIFLDIACCFKGDTLEYVKSALYAHGISPDNDIKVLADKCLIKIDSGHVTMHDLIQDMGREIVRRQSPKEPGKRTRLWFYEDILQVLKENNGTKKIEAINLDMPQDKEVDWSGEAFKKMPNLKILIIRNARFSRSPKYLPNNLRVLDWTGYPYPSLPSDFNPKRLVILKMPKSFLRVDKQLKEFKTLTVMNFKKCKFLTRGPDLSGVPNLEELCLDSCTNLTEVHHSIGFLPKLKRLSFKKCSKLKIFPGIRSPSLELLDLSRCFGLQRFPEILGTMENIRDVFLDHSGIEEMPLSFKNLIGLQTLRLGFCKSLRKVKGIPPNLKELSMAHCIHLSSESRSLLLSQVLHEVQNLQFIIEGDKMPEWLDLYTEGASLSFWIRKKFPNMALCFAAVTEYEWLDAPDVFINIQINGIDIGFAYEESIRLHTSHHVFLFDLQRIVPKAKIETVDLEPKWNHVEISFALSETECSYLRLSVDEIDSLNFDKVVLGSITYRIIDLNLLSDFFLIDNQDKKWFGTPKWCGMYVYNKKSRTEDIRFTNPDMESLPLFLEGLDLNSLPDETDGGGGGELVTCRQLD